MSKRKLTTLLSAIALSATAALSVPTATLIARGRSLVRLDDKGRAAERFTGDPFEAAEAFLAEHAGHLFTNAADDSSA